MRKYLNLRANIALGLIVAFSINSFGPIPTAHAQEFVLPAPGTMVHLSPSFNPPILKGIKVHPDNPFKFDFILDQGDAVIASAAKQSQQEQLKYESTKLIKYFLASLTIPENDLWVNLSPYEKDRIIPNSFGLTEMGRDLLAEDYMLKQITASLIYPEDAIGKKFWKRIYEEAQKKFGTTNIPVNTFNKVWIVPEKAVVYENAQNGTAYVVESKLKVMLEQDYLSLEKHSANIALPSTTRNNVASVGANIVREIIIPELTKEINENKSFTQLRQVYNSLILATWYKKKIRDSILEQVYADKNKVAGVNIDDPQEKQKIYERYLQAFKKGTYNYIKEEIDPSTKQIVPRKYFSGGMDLAMNTQTNLGAANLSIMTDKAMMRHLSKAVSGALLVLSISLTIHQVQAKEKTPQTSVGPLIEKIIQSPSPKTSDIEKLSASNAKQLPASYQNRTKDSWKEKNVEEDRNIWIFGSLVATVLTLAFVGKILMWLKYKKDWNVLLNNMENKINEKQSIRSEVKQALDLMKTNLKTIIIDGDYSWHLDRLAGMVAQVGNEDSIYSVMRQRLILDGHDRHYISGKNLLSLVEQELKFNNTFINHTVTNDIFMNKILMKNRLIKNMVINNISPQYTVFQIFDESIEKNIPEAGYPVFSRYKGLIEAGIYPHGDFFREDKYGKYTIEQLAERARHVRQWGLDINNDLDVILNYSNLISDSQYLGGYQRSTFKDFMDMIEEVRDGKIPAPVTEKIPEKYQLQIRGLVYEAYQMWMKIIDIQKKAEELGRPVIVVENLSYGAVALAPITQQHTDGRQYITGTTTPVISTKIGSSESHRDEYVLRQDLFTQSQVKDLMRREPIVIVVDGSTSVSDSQRTSPHIPDGFKGYRNYFMAYNLAVSDHINPEDFYEDRGFIESLQKRDEFKNLVSNLRQVIPEGSPKYPYQFKFWYPGKKELYLRVNKRKDLIAPKMDTETISGPTVIFMQSAMEPESVPQNIRKEFIKGTHTPAYFDDKDQYKRFFMSYKKGFGFLYSRQYVDFSRKEFSNFLSAYMGISAPIEMTPAVLSTRPVDVLALDLDGTLAQTGQEPSRKIINSLNALIKSGKKLVLLTDDIESNVDNRLQDVLNGVGNDLKPNIVFFTGSAGYTFDRFGTKLYLENYNQSRVFDAEIKNEIENVLTGKFSRELHFDRIEGHQETFSLIVNAQFQRTQVLQDLRQALPQEVKVYKFGSSGIRLVLQHKEDALDLFLKTNGIASEHVLIMADSAKTDHMDRELLSRFPDATNINLGKYSRSLFQRNPSVIQMAEQYRGPRGAQEILDILAKRDNLPEGISKKGIVIDQKEYADAAMNAQPATAAGELYVQVSNRNLNRIKNEKQILRDYADQLMKSLPLDSEWRKYWMNAAEIPVSETVWFPGNEEEGGIIRSPYQIDYYLNLHSSREIILALMLKGITGKLSINGYEDSLNEAHRTLMIGGERKTVYIGMGPFNRPDNGKLKRAVAIKTINDVLKGEHDLIDFYIKGALPISFEKFLAYCDLPPNASREKIVHAISDYYLVTILNKIYPFGGSGVNNSLIMNIVNTMLRLKGFNGISHIDFDSKAAKKDSGEFYEYFLEAFDRANPAMPIKAKISPDKDFAMVRNSIQPRNYPFVMMTRSPDGSISPKPVDINELIKSSGIDPDHLRGLDRLAKEFQAILNLMPKEVQAIAKDPRVKIPDYFSDDYPESVKPLFFPKTNRIPILFLPNLQNWLDFLYAQHPSQSQLDTVYNEYPTKEKDLMASYLHSLEEFAVHEYGHIIDNNGGVVTQEEKSQQLLVHKKKILEDYKLENDAIQRIEKEELDLRAEVYRKSLTSGERQVDAFGWWVHQDIMNSFKDRIHLSMSNFVNLASRAVIFEKNGPQKRAQDLKEFVLDKADPLEKEFFNDMVNYFSLYFDAYHYDPGWLNRLSDEKVDDIGDPAMLTIDQTILEGFPDGMKHEMQEWETPKKLWLFTGGIIEGIRLGWVKPKQMPIFLRVLRDTNTDYPAKVNNQAPNSSRIIRNTNADYYAQVIDQMLDKGWEVNIQEVLEKDLNGNIPAQIQVVMKAMDMGTKIDGKEIDVEKILQYLNMEKGKQMDFRTSNPAETLQDVKDNSNAYAQFVIKAMQLRKVFDLNQVWGVCFKTIGLAEEFQEMGDRDH